MMMQFIKELEQEPFNPEEFVERLAWRSVAGNQDETDHNFDPSVLNDTFVQAIKDLQLLHERQQKKCERLEAQCKEEEENHWQQVGVLQAKNKGAVQTFQELESRITSVATKVLHLGDQLESVNTPRARAVEAQKLMKHFAEFLQPGPMPSKIFTDPAQIDEAADIIQKLHLIAQELPTGKFESAKMKISTTYDKVERSLIEEFVKAHNAGNRARMKEIASILSQFKGYSQCVDAFIETSQMGAFTGKDVFQDVVPLCEKNFIVMKEVFSKPDQVMAKYVLNIFHLKLQKHIVSTLNDKTVSLDVYLRNFADLYSRTVKLTEDLSKYDMGSDSTYLNKLTNNLFQKYMEPYISIETRCLREKCSSLLLKFYNAKGHQKKNLQTGGFQDVKREVLAVIGARANLNIAQIENYGGETFLSEEVAIAILQESTAAFDRCKLLSSSDEVGNNAGQLIEVLFFYLVVDFIDYAVELGVNAVPIPESKNQPQVYFFDVVRQTNAIIHLLEKTFKASVHPLIASSPKHGEWIQKKKQMLEKIEMKLDTGLDRTLDAIVGWVKIYLQSEQKKTDFKPETDVDTLSSSACLAVVQFMNGIASKIRTSIDGKNIESAFMELGIRFHRVVFEHLQQFQFNSAGAMCVICDVNEYRKCVKQFNVPIVSTLFDSLHALCNLLLVKPENLKQVCTGEQLSGLDRSILLNFIQLRSDYKTQRLANYLKGVAT